MILFLDTVSSLPEFSLIEDNKIINNIQILSKSNDKMSDLLIPSYLKLEKKYDLSANLRLLIINTGPGSYTALRVGIAFFFGLSLSYNIGLIGISCADLYRFEISKDELSSSVIHISSSNDQNFLCFLNTKNIQHKIEKIEKNIVLGNQDFDLSAIKNIYTNQSLEEGEKQIPKNIKINIIKFSEIIRKNIKKINKLKKNEIIQPIYFSNNKILN